MLSQTIASLHTFWLTSRYVSGALGQTGQWVVTDLLSKGFAVRAFVRNLDRAEVGLKIESTVWFQIVKGLFKWSSLECCVYQRTIVDEDVQA